MGTKIKGIYTKGFKYISQIFVVKEREMEIGYPTDCKHVAHIGWDGQSGSAPSWMNEFKASSDYSTSSLGNNSEFRDLSTWSSQDFEQSMGPVSEMFQDFPPAEIPKPTKQKRKKSKSTSPKCSSTSRSSRAAKSKTGYADPTTLALV